jgi:hypothetical protein
MCSSLGLIYRRDIVNSRFAKEVFKDDRRVGESK